MDTIRIALKDLVQNTGQIPGLPANPRQWTKKEIDKIAKSLQETPELFEARPIIVTQYAGKFVILGGNLRYEGCKKNKDKDAPCFIIPDDTPIDKMKEIIIKDNGSFGEWDYDALGNLWDDLPLAEWGVPDWVAPDKDDEDDGGGTPPPEKDEKVEALLRDAMRENITEALEQIDYMMQRGWIAQFLTLGAVKAQFLRAKYYGKHYPQYLSLYFCPQRFMTSAYKRSIYEQMRKCAQGAEAGIAGFRTISEDGPLMNVVLRGSYPIAGARMPLDFPAGKARELIEEFGGEGCSVLDPCHGWGGRLTGALMADVALYCGVDPSPDANAGVRKAADAFLPYCPASRVELIKAPFEDVDLDKRVFDMAITSPPYFDVEQYSGEEQSHNRYGNYDKWVDRFYRVLIEKTYKALKGGGVFVLQVGSKSYPLLKDGTRIAEEVGFTVEDVRPFGGGTNSGLHRNDDEDIENEKVIILRK